MRPQSPDPVVRSISRKMHPRSLTPQWGQPSYSHVLCTCRLELEEGSFLGVLSRGLRLFSLQLQERVPGLQDEWFSPRAFIVHALPSDGPLRLILQRV